MTLTHMHKPLSPHALKGGSMKSLARRFGLHSPTRRIKSAYRRSKRTLGKYAKKYGVSSPLRRVKGFASNISNYVSQLYNKGKKTLKSLK
jgi:hypothetical protein